MSWATDVGASPEEVEGTTMQDCVLGFASSVLALFAIAAAMIGSAEAPKGPEPEGAWHARPVTVLVLCDASTSMDPVLTKLKEALRTLAEIGSRLSPKFELGIRLHWGKGLYRQEVFEFTEIGPTVDGQKSAGRKNLDAFLDDKVVERTIVTGTRGEAGGGTRTGETRMYPRMDTHFGFVDLPDALTGAVKALGDECSSDERCVLIVIGDQACHEIDRNPDTLTGDEKAAGVRARSFLAANAFLSEDLRVWSLFTGKDLPASPFRAETVAYFKSLAEAAKDNGRYTDDITDLSAAAIEAVFSPPAKEKAR